MDEGDSRFKQVLNDVVAAAVGRPLAGVAYRTIQHECSAADVASGIGWFGGEVELRFAGVPPFVVTWGENERWNDHFSVLIRRETAFVAGSLVPFDATAAPEWARHVGKNLVGAQCRGYGGTPHLLVLFFPAGAVVIGDGHENEFGDGDDVVIRPRLAVHLEAFPEIIWAAGSGGLTSHCS